MNTKSDKEIPSSKTITIPLELAEEILETLPVSWHIATTLKKQIETSKSLDETYDSSTSLLEACRIASKQANATFRVLEGIDLDNEIDSIKEKGFITFHPLDVPLNMPSSHYIKALIKEANGPVSGTTKLTYIAGYEMHEEIIQATQRITVGWRLKR